MFVDWLNWLVTLLELVLLPIFILISIVLLFKIMYWGKTEFLPKKLSLKLALTSLLFAGFFLFSAGSFVTGVVLERHDNEYNYYLHRGFPIVYNGVIKSDSPPLPYPFITLKNLKKTLVSSNTTYVKLIDVNRLLFAFVFYVLISLLPVQLFLSKLKSDTIWMMLTVALLLSLIGAFSSWTRLIV